MDMGIIARILGQGGGPAYVNPLIDRGFANSGASHNRMLGRYGEALPPSPGPNAMPRNMGTMAGVPNPTPRSQGILGRVMQQQGAPASPTPPQPTQPQPGGQGILGRMRGFMGDNRMALMGMGAGILNNGLAGGPGGAFQGSQLDYARSQDEQARADQMALLNNQTEQRARVLTPEEAQAMRLPDPGPGAVWEQQPDGGVRRRGGGGTNVTVNNGSDPVAIEEIVKDTVELSTADIQAGQTAARTSQSLAQLESLLQTAPQGMAGGLAGVANNLGIAVDGGDEVAAAQAILNQLAPQQRPEGSGPMSDADLALFQASLPRIINQPGGNQIILRGMQALNQYDQARGRIAEQYQEMLVTGMPQAEALRFYRSQMAQLNASTPSLGQMLGQAGVQATQPSQRGGRLTPAPDGVLEYR
jgi:hypothetical protein